MGVTPSRLIDGLGQAYMLYIICRMRSLRYVNKAGNQPVKRRTKPRNELGQTPRRAGKTPYQISASWVKRKQNLLGYKSTKKTEATSTRFERRSITLLDPTPGAPFLVPSWPFVPTAEPAVTVGVAVAAP